MTDSASPDDRAYKLRAISATPFLFRVRKGARLPESGTTGEIVRYLLDHAGAGMTELRTCIPALGEPTYEAYQHARDQVARLVEAGVLEVCGEVPLEEVDPRYERVPACAVCGAPSSSHPVLFWKYNTPVVRCTTCGLLYANPRWRAEYLFGRYTDDYWELYKDRLQNRQSYVEHEQGRTDHYLWTIEHGFSTGRLLDVGCATGEFLAATQARGWQAYGVETSPASAQIARELTGAQIHTGTLDTAPFEQGSFDVITMFEVIEHLQSPRSYIEIISRLLRPGGLLAISTPNIRSVSYRLLGRDWDVVGPNDHLYYFSPRTLQRLLADHGFAIHTMYAKGTDPAVWKQALRFRALQPLASPLARLTAPLVARFMQGDQIYLVATLTQR